MKNFLLSMAISGFSVMAVQAQESRNELLSAYYQLKDVLVQGNAKKAAEQAGYFIKLVNQSPLNEIKPFKDALLKDAGKIAASADINSQRKDFAPFSNTMILFAKAAKLDNQAIYVDYCPMKKTYWLSADKAIKNPYYGATMLTCGSITDTLQ
ncbi:DUF3347 domain-containing protein [Flavihumibacter sp. UBA7668]|uniref:DUF3347 domain-containing protein n=1 Tax=Flavihumibacter sp. UBA7668 TaxID=1946542 RepID=UPI0025C6C814|nr:DUF3347 domain-containing protein [Flavihumibacter sp. UBA7668]